MLMKFGNFSFESYDIGLVWRLFSTSVFSFRWSDWHCGTTRDGDSYLFKPLCQKDKDSPDLTGPDPTTSTTTVRPPSTTSDNDKILPDLLQCVDTGVKYKSNGRLQNINYVILVLKGVHFIRTKESEKQIWNYLLLLFFPGRPKRKLQIE